ncbi:hypothetical protein ACFL2G_03880 [Candidatus Omnitrophota bacterium]
MNKYILIILLMSMCVSTAVAEVQNIEVPPDSGRGELGWTNLSESNTENSEQKSSVGVDVDVDAELKLTDTISVRTKYNEEDEEACLVGTFEF